MIALPSGPYLVRLVEFGFNCQTMAQAKDGAWAWFVICSLSKNCLFDSVLTSNVQVLEQASSTAVTEDPDDTPVSLHGKLSNSQIFFWQLS